MYSTEIVCLGNFMEYACSSWHLPAEKWDSIFPITKERCSTFRHQQQPNRNHKWSISYPKKLHSDTTNHYMAPFSQNSVILLTRVYLTKLKNSWRNFHEIFLNGSIRFKIILGIIKQRSRSARWNTRMSW